MLLLLRKATQLGLFGKKKAFKLEETPVGPPLNSSLKVNFCTNLEQITNFQAAIQTKAAVQVEFRAFVGSEMYNSFSHFNQLSHFRNLFYIHYPEKGLSSFAE